MPSSSGFDNWRSFMRNRWEFFLLLYGITKGLVSKVTSSAERKCKVRLPITIYFITLAIGQNELSSQCKVISISERKMHNPYFFHISVNPDWNNNISAKPHWKRNKSSITTYTCLGKTLQEKRADFSSYVKRDALGLTTRVVFVWALRPQLARVGKRISGNIDGMHMDLSGS